MANTLISPRDFWRLLHKIADRHLGPAELAFLRAIDVTVDEIDQAMLLSGLAAHNVDLVFLAIPLGAKLEPAIRESYSHILGATFREAGVATSTLEATGTLRFDLTNPEAIRWAQREAGALVQQVSLSVKQSVRDTVFRGFNEGRTPTWMAKEIRQVIGLTRKQTQAVSNFERLLREGKAEVLTRALRDHRFDPTIRKAIESGEGLTEAQIDRMTKRYAERMLRYRADMIARSETIKASSAGQQELWRQAVAEGYLDAQKTRQIWIVVPDERLCPICRMIPVMNPKGVPLGQAFQSPVGPVMRPAETHPACRCGLSLLQDAGAGFQVPPFVRQMAEAA